ncbi:MAG: hypothetical protein LBS43_10515 [Prevotellaceae bacterium]|jgi:hypothetical protein|nr:hypothetical protein [Prevotellaceae bacterium]
MRKQFCLSILLIVVCCILKAQYVDYGEDPARLRWRQIKTEHYRVIYPASNERRANLYADILETIYSYERNTLQTKRSSVVPIILHPYSVSSNGMVSWAPKRMELLPSPDFDSRLQRPELNLLTHESRHIVQMDKQNSGIFRPFYFLFGEQTIGIASFLKPQWLLEGEAVVAETALSSSGRGRKASFLTPYRAQIATGKNFSLDKWFLGSYRDNTHDFYALGYAMTSYSRLNYGADVWNKVWNDMNRSLFYPFALKKNTGLTSTKLFKATFEALGKEWDALTPENPDSLTFISKKHRRYISYKYPQEIENGVICLKTSLSDIPAIVLINSSGKEHFLTYTGNINSKLIHSDGFVYWTEYIPGIRWQHENYSVVKQLNLQTLQVETISKRSRYFTPAVSLTKIAVFEHEPDGQNNIVLIDRSGQKLKSYPVIDNMPVQDMVIDDNGKILAVLTGKGNAVFRLDPNTSQWEKLLDYQRTNIESLQIHGERLLFESGYNGVNNIYSFDTVSLSVKQLTNSIFGSFSGTFARDGSKLYVSDYSAKGYRIASIDTKRLNEKNITFDNPYKFRTAEALSAQESFNIDDYTFSDTVKYVSKPYKKAANLFNIHSWFPFYLNLDEATENYRFEYNQIKPGVFLLSQNRLNTLTSQASYYYDNIEKVHHGFLSLKYSGWFPVLSFKMNVGGQKYRIAYDGSHIYALENRNRVTATFSAYLPLKFTNDYNVHGLQPFTNFKYDDRITGNEKQQYYTYLHAGVYYYRYRTLAHNDIFPKFGWQMWLNYIGNPTNDMSELLVGKANLYLPGILRSHRLRISASAQRQLISDNTRYHFFDQYVDIARGQNYSNYIDEKQIYTVKGDYSFPIVYPDLKVGSLMYLSRIRGNIFYDVTIKQPSYGFDLTLDMFLLRIRYSPVTLMFRTVKIPGYDFINSFSMGVSF